jgi:hypothetical protein
MEIASFRHKAGINRPYNAMPIPIAHALILHLSVTALGKEVASDHPTGHTSRSTPPERRIAASILGNHETTLS